MGEVARVLLEQGCPAVAGLLLHGPGGQPGDRTDEGDADGQGAQRRRQRGSTTAQLDGLDAAAGADRLAEACPTARDALQGDGQQREAEDQGGELARRVAVVGAPPDAEHPDGDGVHAEVLDRGEVGERLHHDHGRAGGDGRADEGQHDAPGGLAGRGAEDPGGVVGAGRLVAQRGAGQQVDVGVQHQGEGGDGATDRLHRREPGVASEPGGPLVLDRPGAPERRQGQEPQDVAGHGQRQDERPAQQPRTREPVRADHPGQARAEHPGAGGGARQQDHGVQQLAGEPGAPLLGPHVGAGLQHADGEEEHRDGDGDRHRHRHTGPWRARGEQPLARRRCGLERSGQRTTGTRLRPSGARRRRSTRRSPPRPADRA